MCQVFRRNSLLDEERLVVNATEPWPASAKAGAIHFMNALTSDGEISDDDAETISGLTANAHRLKPAFTYSNDVVDLYNIVGLRVDRVSNPIAVSTRQLHPALGAPRRQAAACR